MSTYFDSEASKTLALSLARGCYQRRLLDGRQDWSGADLRGTARTWSSSYGRSREALLARMWEKGLRAWYYYLRPGGYKVLVVYSDPTCDPETLLPSWAKPQNRSDSY